MNVKLAGSRRLAGIAAMSAVALTLAACGNGDTSDASTPGSSSTDAGAGELSGSIAGSGASSQESAVQGWIAGFMDQNPDVNVTYDPTGSGTGREQFLNGTVLFAGSDAAMDEEELAAGVDRCYGGEVIEMPLYISPIAIVYNLPGVDAEHLNLDPETIAGIFMGEVTSWDDPAIV